MAVLEMMSSASMAVWVAASVGILWRIHRLVSLEEETLT